MTMSNHYKKPHHSQTLKLSPVRASLNVESVDLEFSNGVRRVYERMRPSTREAVDDCADCG